MANVLPPKVEEARETILRATGRDYGPKLAGRQSRQWAAVVLQLAPQFEGEAPPAHSGRSLAEYRANAAACPHCEPIPRDERAGCGCTRRCTAGRSPREDGGVQITDCWDCELAPRRAESPRTA